MDLEGDNSAQNKEKPVMIVRASIQRQRLVMLQDTSKLSETVFLELQREAFWVLRPVCSS